MWRWIFFFFFVFIPSLRDKQPHKPKNHIRTPCDLDLDLDLEISRDFSIYEYFRRNLSLTVFDRFWWNLKQFVWIIVLIARSVALFWIFASFFHKMQYLATAYQKISFLILSCIFYHFMKKWGKNLKKGDGARYKQNIPKSLPPISSKSVKNCRRR